MSKLVMVCGTSRSGSTMLDVMLGSSPNAFSCGEVTAWFRPFRRHHRRIDCPCGEEPCPVWDLLKRLPEREFHAEAASRMGVDFVIDSSKDLCWLIDAQRWAHVRGLTTNTIVIWKDPVELAHSFWKRGQNLDEWRRHFVPYHRRIFDLGLPVVAVPLSRLTADPADTLAKVCRAIGMEYVPSQERFWEKKHHHLFGSGGVRRQIATGRSSIRSSGELGADFEPHREPLNRRIAKDTEVQDILRRLDAASVFGPGGVRAEPGSPLRRPYPLWYYLETMRRMGRRYVPEPYEEAPIARPSQGESRGSG